MQGKRGKERTILSPCFTLDTHSQKVVRMSSEYRGLGAAPQGDGDEGGESVSDDGGAPRGGLGSAGTRRWEQDGDWGDDSGGEDSALTAKYGIGAKLLKGMGWRSGQGLGKEGTGIAEPIQVKVRPKNLGLAYNFQEKTQQQRREEKRANADSGVLDAAAEYEDEDDEDGNEDDEEEDDIEAWMKDQDRVRVRGRGQRRRGRGRRAAAGPVAMVDDELHSAGSSAAEPVVIVDATGGAKREGPLAPLEHNAVLLAHMAAERAQAARRGVAQAQQRVAAAVAECARIEDRLAVSRRHVRDAEAFLAALDGVINNGDNSKSGDDAAVLACAQLRAVRAQFPVQWKRFGGHAAALAVAEAQLSPRVAAWDALRQPALLCSAFAEWRAFFGVEVASLPVMDSSSSEDEDDKDNNMKTGTVVDSPWYERLLEDVLVPRVRRTVLRWDPREDEEGRMVDLVGTLGRAVLTAGVRRRVVAELVYPRVLERVRRWRPQADARPVDRWVLPWFAHLAPEQREALWALVAQRVASVLRAAWTTPLDTSAHTVLQPWRTAAPTRSFTSLLMTHITPVLQRALSQIVFHPCDVGEDAVGEDGEGKQSKNNENNDENKEEASSREMFKAVMLWEDVLPRATLVSLLTVEFFPRWLQCVRAWLVRAGGGADRTVFARVGQWYRAWRALLPPWTTRLTAVQEPLALALEMLDRAMAGEDVASADVVVVGAATMPLEPSYADQSKQQQQQQQAQKQLQQQQRQQQQQEQEERVDLREVLEQVATANDVEFVPTTRTHDGLPVYRFGHTSIVLDARVVRAHDPATSSWPAISLAALLALQHQHHQGAHAPPPTLD